MSFKKFNYQGTAVLPQNTDITSLEFKPLKDFIGEDLIVRGYFFTEGKFGLQVVIYTTTKTYPNGVKINMPKRYADDFKKFDEEDKAAVLSGHCMITNIKEIETKQGKSIGLEFADC